MSKLREYLIRFQMLLFNLYALTYFPPNPPHAFLIHYICWCTVNFATLPKRFLAAVRSPHQLALRWRQLPPEPAPRQRGRQAGSLPVTLCLCLLTTSATGSFQPHALHMLKIGVVAACLPAATGKAGQRRMLRTAAASPSMQQSPSEIKQGR